MWLTGVLTDATFFGIRSNRALADSCRQLIPESEEKRGPAPGRERAREREKERNLVKEKYCTLSATRTLRDFRQARWELRMAAAVLPAYDQMRLSFLEGNIRMNLTTIASHLNEGLVGEVDRLVALPTATTCIHCVTGE